MVILCRQLGVCYGTASCRVNYQLIAVTVEDLWGPCRTVTSCRVFTCASSQIWVTLTSFTAYCHNERLQQGMDSRRS